MIKNYDSRNTLSTYNLGDTCAFYIYNVGLSRFVRVNVEGNVKYAKALDKVIKESRNLINHNGKYHKLTRAIGVVVEKIEATTSKGIDMIKVMFKTMDNDYIFNKYAVGVEHVETNGKNYVQPASVINLSAD